jgi:membrane protein DedA with SNARE-associated domain
VPDAATLWKYVGVFAALIAAGMGAPIPEEIPVATGGALVGHGSSRPNPEAPDWAVGTLGLPVPEASGPVAAAAQADVARQNSIPLPPHPVWWIMLPVCIAGVVLSDTILYSIGRHGGARLLEHHWVQRHLVKPDKRAKIERNFQKYGVKILLGARLLPGIRAPIFIMAGVMRLPMTRFVLADGLYALIGVNLLFWLGFWGGDAFADLVRAAEHKVQSLVRPLLIIGALAAVGAYLLRLYLTRNVVTGDPKEVPVIGEKIIHAAAPPAGGR